MKFNEKFRTAVRILTLGTAFITSAIPVNANAIMETEWFQGGMRLASDATAAGIVIFPVIGLAFAGYFWFRRGIAEPEEKNGWRKRAIDAMLIGVIVGLISGIASLITSYLA